MKSTRRICAIALGLALLLSGCGAGAARRAAREINGASALPMALLTPRAGVNPAGYDDYIPNYTSSDYYGEDYTLSFGGFPTDKDKYFLTGITWTGEGFDLFGVKVGDDPRQAAEMIQARGYTRTGDGYISEFDKNGVTVRLTGDAIIEKISIHVPTAFTSGNLY